MNDSDACTELAAAIKGVGTGLLVVVTGAGVSLARGIPTFRGSDPGAVWTRDITDLGTNRYFEEDPAGSWSWYTSRFSVVLEKRPNAAHHALVAVERAGSERLVKVHGCADRVRCSRRGCVNGAPHGSMPRARVDMRAFEAEPVCSSAAD